MASIPMLRATGDHMLLHFEKVPACIAADRQAPPVTSRCIQEVGIQLAMSSLRT